MLRVEWGEVNFSPTHGPNGNYLYRGQPFTGLRYKLTPNGMIACEEEYRQGLRWGQSREWYRSGNLYREATYYRDVLHGVEREWYEKGQLQEERICEYGILLRETKWDSDGNVTLSYELKEGDPDYDRLMHYREVSRGLDD